MADTESILQLGIEAARAGDKAEARELFRLVTREDPQNSQGWLWLAGVAEDREEKRSALERVIELDPNNDLARKGLSALGGPRGGAAAAGAATAGAAAAVPEEPAPPIVADTSEADVRPVEAQPVEEVGAPVSHGHARRYDAPEPAAPAAAVTDDADAVPPPAYTDDYDLQDYQQEPRAVAADYDDDAPRVIVEGEEEPRRRGGLAWLPLLLALGALVLAGLFLFNTFRNRDPGTGIAGITDPSGPGATATTDGAIGGVSGTQTAGTGGTVNVVPLDGTLTAEASPGEATAAPDTTGGTTAGPATAGETAAPPDTQTAPVPAPVQTAAAPGAGATAVAGAAATAAPAADATQAPAGPAQTQAPAAAEQTPAPAAQTTIVVVAPSATVIPPTPAPTQAPPPPPPPAAPPAPPDVAAANPAVVPNGTVVQAGQWGFTATNFQNIATGSYGGSPPTRGQYRVVVLQVANNTGQPATIPDGFFVVKDAQGRVYDFNRAASVDYLNRFGGPGVAADIGADTPLPSNNSLTSVPLLFDVPPDATNLVLFSRENMNQGFQLR